jgi:RHS repeat-associated protein
MGYDSNSTWADLNGSNVLQTRYLRGDQIDQLIARVVTSGSTPAASWYLADRLGSIRNITDANGNTIDTITYDGFGNVTNETNASAGDRWKFTGREFDSETGLQYNRARDYNAADGRWTSQDPLGFGAGDGNLYRYVRNWPINATDPRGLDWPSWPYWPYSPFFPPIPNPEFHPPSLPSPSQVMGTGLGLFGGGLMGALGLLLPTQTTLESIKPGEYGAGLPPEAKVANVTKAEYESSAGENADLSPSFTWIPQENTFGNIPNLKCLYDKLSEWNGPAIDVLAIGGHGSNPAPGVYFKERGFAAPIPDDLAQLIRSKMSARGHLVILSCCDLVLPVDFPALKPRAQKLANQINRTVTYPQGGTVNGNGAGTGKWVVVNPE